jgi:hypothetical protein
VSTAIFTAQITSGQAGGKKADSARRDGVELRERLNPERNFPKLGYEEIANDRNSSAGCGAARHSNIEA